MDDARPVPGHSTAAFALGAPTDGFRSLVYGRGWPAAQAVKKVVWVASTLVSVAITEAAEPGMGPTPVTGTLVVEFSPSGPDTAVPVRESTIRVGVTEVYLAPDPSRVKYPTTSTMTAAVPPWYRTVSWPFSVPISTRLAATPPTRAFAEDVPVEGCVPGLSSTYPGADAPAMVTFATTPASDVGCTPRDWARER